MFGIGSIVKVHFVKLAFTQEVKPSTLEAWPAFKVMGQFLQLAINPSQAPEQDHKDSREHHHS